MADKMILCCGEALIDMVPRLTAEGDEAFLPLPGGAVYNTALSLGRLDVPVGFFSGLSTDVFGRKLVSFHHESHVDTSFAAISDRPTTLAIVELNNGHATYTFMDENSAGRMLADSDIPGDLSRVSAVYFGGISLCAEPAASVYAQMCERHAADHVVMIDPNIRPSFITDEPAYRARIEGMIAVSDIVKVSDEDLDWLYPGAGPAKILELGPKIVLMTKGADGAEAHRASGVVSVPGVPATVVDTVGAGDTFNAGFLAALQHADVLTKDGIATLSDDVLKTALSKGAQVASVTVSRAGANPPWASELG